MKKYHKIVFVFSLAILLIVISCGEKNKPTTSVSSNALQKDTMIAVMVDVHILEAAVSFNQINAGTTNQNSDKYFDVFKKHSITLEKYEQSLKEYAKNPEELNKMYDQVIEKLSKMQADVNKNNVNSFNSQ